MLSRPRCLSQEGCSTEARAAPIYLIPAKAGVPMLAPSLVQAYIRLCAPLQGRLYSYFHNSEAFASFAGKQKIISLPHILS